MPTERQRKLGLLARKNLARTEHPYYLTELSHVLKYPVAQEDVLNLEKTDEFFSRFNYDAGLPESDSTLQITWPHDPSSTWIRICFCLAEQLRSEQVVLFAGPYDYCGAVQTKAEYPLVNAASVLAFDQDTVRMQSLDADGGLYLDLYEEDSTRWIELKVWGEWCARAKVCMGR